MQNCSVTLQHLNLWEKCDTTAVAILDYCDQIHWLDRHSCKKKIENCLSWYYFLPSMTEVLRWLTKHQTKAMYVSKWICTLWRVETSWVCVEILYLWLCIAARLMFGELIIFEEAFPRAVCLWAVNNNLYLCDLFCDCNSGVTRSIFSLHYSLSIIIISSSSSISSISHYSPLFSFSSHVFFFLPLSLFFLDPSNIAAFSKKKKKGGHTILSWYENEMSDELLWLAFSYFRLLLSADRQRTKNPQPTKYKTNKQNCSHNNVCLWRLK